MIIARNNWETAKDIIGYPKFYLLLMLFSRQRVKAPLKVSHNQYIQITGKRLNNFRKYHTDLVTALNDFSPSKSYINIPNWYFTIPLKNKFELLYYHYVITKTHDTIKGTVKLSFDDFVEKYKIKRTKDNRKKWNTYHLTNRKLYDKIKEDI